MESKDLASVIRIGILATALVLVAITVATALYHTTALREGYVEYKGSRAVIVGAR